MEGIRGRRARHSLQRALAGGKTHTVSKKKIEEEPTQPPPSAKESQPASPTYEECTNSPVDVEPAPRKGVVAQMIARKAEKSGKT